MDAQISISSDGDQSDSVLILGCQEVFILSFYFLLYLGFIVKTKSITFQYPADNVVLPAS